MKAKKNVCGAVWKGDDSILAANKMIPAATMDEALQIATGKLGASCDVLIVPHAMLTSPIVQEKHIC